MHYSTQANDMAFMEPMHRNKPNITYLLNLYALQMFYHIEGLVQDWSNSSALAVELLQSCTNPSIWWC